LEKKLTVPAILLAIVATGVTDWRIAAYPSASAWKSIAGPVCLAVLVGILIV
jgi:hypothetical protein